MVMPASCDGADPCDRLTYQSLCLTRVTQTPAGNMSHARLGITCDTGALGQKSHTQMIIIIICMSIISIISIIIIIIVVQTPTL